MSIPRKLLILLGCALLHQTATAQVPDPPAEYRSTAIGVTFPLELAGLPMMHTIDYEKQSPGLGVGVAYGSRHMKVDIYIYNAGLPRIPPGIDSPEIKAVYAHALREISAMEKAGRYHDVKIVSENEQTLIGATPMLHTELTFRSDGPPLISHIYLGVLKNQFFKIRCTYAASEAETDGRVLQRLLGDLAKLLDTPR